MAKTQHIVAVLAILACQCGGEELQSNPSDLTDKPADTGNRNAYEVEGGGSVYYDPRFLVSYKRAPSGFVGMRGKKDSDEMKEEVDKRVPSGFLGMRGKKEMYQSSSSGTTFLPSNDFENTLADIKRSPMSGFFGMRGKKEPNRSDFFGMRGKKYPFEFRGKFVGVRGKKSIAGLRDIDVRDLSRFARQLDLNQLMLLLTANDYDIPSEESLRNQVF